MKKIIASTLFLSLIACAPKTTEVVEDVEKVETTESLPVESERVAEGRKVYNEHCGKCHKLKDVPSFTQAQWKTIVPDMAKKSKLTLEQEAAVMNYVLEYAKK
jgi:cytochrome c5